LDVGNYLANDFEEEKNFSLLLLSFLKIKIYISLAKI
jgi:hypothetical protein